MKKNHDPELKFYSKFDGILFRDIVAELLFFILLENESIHTFAIN